MIRCQARGSYFESRVRVMVWKVDDHPYTERVLNVERTQALLVLSRTNFKRNARASERIDLPIDTLTPHLGVSLHLPTGR